MADTTMDVETTVTTATNNDETDVTPDDPSSVSPSVPLPSNRFALELEFVQSLASPAYLHYLATSTTSDGGQSLLLDPKFRQFLKYLYETWSRPEYSRYITYPHSLYFLCLLCDDNDTSFARELGQVSFRNFCHQQQYYAWQNRFATLYGTSGAGVDPTKDEAGADDNSNNNNHPNQDVQQSQEQSDAQQQEETHEAVAGTGATMNASSSNENNPDMQ